MLILNTSLRPKSKLNIFLWFFSTDQCCFISKTAHFLQFSSKCCCDVSCQLIYTGFGATFPSVEVGRQCHLQSNYFSTASKVFESNKASSSQLTEARTCFQISNAIFHAQIFAFFFFFFALVHTLWGSGFWPHTQ